MFYEKKTFEQNHKVHLLLKKIEKLKVLNTLLLEQIKYYELNDEKDFQVLSEENILRGKSIDSAFIDEIRGDQEHDSNRKLKGSINRNSEIAHKIEELPRDHRDI